MTTLQEIAEELNRVAKEHEVATRLLGTLQVKLDEEKKARIEGETLISELQGSLREVTRVCELREEEIVGLQDTEEQLEIERSVLEADLEKMKGVLREIQTLTEGIPTAIPPPLSGTRSDMPLFDVPLVSQTPPEREKAPYWKAPYWKVPLFLTSFNFMEGLSALLSGLFIFMATLVVLAQAGIYILPPGFGYVSVISDEMKILVGYSLGSAFLLGALVFHLEKGRREPRRPTKPAPRDSSVKEEESDVSLSEDILEEMFDAEEPRQP